MSWLVNVFTGLNLVSGLASIIFSLQMNFIFASWAILFSVISDGLDGYIARRSYRLSDFGKEFDSLADAISFGIAPAILSYILIYRYFYLSATLALYLYLFCCVIRLAQYNVTPKEKMANYFYGLPTTICGGIIASFILVYRRYSGMPSPIIFLLLVLALSYLMICQIRYLNIFGLRQILGKKLLPLSYIAVAVAVFFPEATIFTLLLAYVFSSHFIAVKLIDNK